MRAFRLLQYDANCGHIWFESWQVRGGVGVGGTGVGVGNGGVGVGTGGVGVGPEPDEMEKACDEQSCFARVSWAHTLSLRYRELN